MRAGGGGRRPVSRGDVVAPGGVGRRHGHRVAHPVCGCRAALAARTLVVLMGGAAPRACWGRGFFFVRVAPVWRLVTLCLRGGVGPSAGDGSARPAAHRHLLHFLSLWRGGGGSENERSLVTTRLDGHKGRQLQYPKQHLAGGIGCTPYAYM